MLVSPLDRLRGCRTTAARILSRSTFADRVVLAVGLLLTVVAMLVATLVLPTLEARAAGTPTTVGVVR